MPKFSGLIGFWLDDLEEIPGYYNPLVEERHYKGDVLNETRRWENQDSQNEGFRLTTRISVISDIFLRKHWHSIKYIIMDGVKLKVTSIDLSRPPRIVLSIGGVYHDANDTRFVNTTN